MRIISKTITRCSAYDSLRKFGQKAIVLGMAVCAPTWALDYGIFDSRGLAMGGATVATATGQHAQFYNPALLAMYTGEEEDTRNGRVMLPILLAQESSSVQETVDILDQDLDVQLSNAVNAFNADTTAENAALVGEASRDLQTAINDVGNKDLSGEAFVGFSVSEPANREGGSFYFGVRTIGDGNSVVSEADLALLQSYIDTMDFFAEGGGTVPPHPELFDENGNLIDPRDAIESFANIASLSIAEWGVAVAKEFSLWGQPVAFGITPKVMRVDVFVDQLTYANTDINYNEDKRTHFAINADVGVVVPIGDHFRVALASKDILPQSYEAASTLSVETSARSRLAGSYINKYVTVGLDLDLKTNVGIGSGRETKEAALGIELRPLSWIDVRMGYRNDMKGYRAPVMSAGMGMRIGRILVDFAYAKSEDIRGGGLQLGWTF